jgi:hypothetical protein
MDAHSPTAEPPFTLSRRPELVVTAALNGDITGPIIREFAAALQHLVDEAPTQIMVVDLTGMRRFTSDIRAPVVECMRALSARGQISLSVVVTASPLARMTGTAMALAARKRTVLVADMAEARRLVARALATPRA